MHPSIERSVNVIPGTILRVVFRKFSTVNVTTTNAHVSVVALDTARENFANAAVSTGDAIKAYANAMLQSFSVKELGTGALVTPWYDVVGGALGKSIKEERAKFVALFTARGFDKPTIDVYWSRVKIASGKPKTVTRVQSSGSALDDATLADLKTLINRIMKSDEEGALAQQYKGDLMDVYAGLGGDTDKLGK